MVFLYAHIWFDHHDLMFRTISLIRESWIVVPAMCRGNSGRNESNHVVELETESSYAFWYWITSAQYLGFGIRVLEIKSIFIVIWNAHNSVFIAFSVSKVEIRWNCAGRSVCTLCQWNISALTNSFLDLECCRLDHFLERTTACVSRVESWELWKCWISLAARILHVIWLRARAADRYVDIMFPSLQRPINYN